MSVPSLGDAIRRARLLRSGSARSGQVPRALFVDRLLPVIGTAVAGDLDIAQTSHAGLNTIPASDPAQLGTVSPAQGQPVRWPTEIAPAGPQLSAGHPATEQAAGWPPLDQA